LLEALSAPGACGVILPLQVVGDGGLADVDRLDDLAHRHRPSGVGEQVADDDPGGVGQRLEPAGIGPGGGAIDLHRQSTIIDQNQF